VNHEFVCGSGVVKVVEGEDEAEAEEVEVAVDGAVTIA
jgi:hypothetical protein